MECISGGLKLATITFSKKKNRFYLFIDLDHKSHVSHRIRMMRSKLASNNQTKLSVLAVEWKIFLWVIEIRC